MGWIYANVFMLLVCLAGAGAMRLWGAGMWALNMPPDEHPAIAFVGAFVAIYSAYIAAKVLYRLAVRFRI